MTMDGRMQDMIVVITGAGRGVGRAIASVYAKEKAQIVLVARSKAELEETANICKSNGATSVEVMCVDLADSKAVNDLAHEVLKKKQRVDVLVNNAGMLRRGGPLDGIPDEWEDMFKVNVHAPMRLTRIFSEGMAKRERGVIVNISSIAALEGMSKSGGYAASKFALRGWSLSCYEVLRGYGIKVVAIHPAYIDTKMVAGNPDLRYDRMLKPDDIAEAAMLPIITSPSCCPQEITLRLTKLASG